MAAGLCIRRSLDESIALIVGSVIAVELIREESGTATCAPTKVKPMRCALPFLLAGILIASPAFAFSDLETQVRSIAGGAIAR